MRMEMCRETSHFKERVAAMNNGTEIACRVWINLSQNTDLR